MTIPAAHPLRKTCVLAAALFLLVCFSASLPASAASPASVKMAPVYIDALRNYNDEQSLSQASINAILQTHDGYLWLGTFGGLVRFDGQQFHTFHAGQVDDATQTTSGPGSERIVALREDPLHRLWIATQDAGVSVYQEGRFHPVPFVCNHDCQIIGMVIGADQHLSVLTRESLYRISLADLGHERIGLPDGSSFGDIGVAGNGEVYLAGLSGLVRVRADGTLEPISLPTANKTIKKAAFNATNLWLFTEPGDLYRYRPADGALLHVRADLPHDTLLATANNGITYISDSAHGIRRLADSGEETPFLPTPDFSNAVFDDDEGNTWLGTTTHGLLRKHQSSIGLLAAPEARMDVAPGRAVIGDGNGGLWFGTINDGVRHWQRDGSVQTLMLPPTMYDKGVSSLLLDRRGTLWVTTHSGFLGKLAQGSIHEVDALPAEGTLNIQQTADGSYWLGTSLHTYRLDIDKDGNLQGHERIPQLDGMAIASMLDSKRGGIWFVGNRGAYRLQDGRIVEQWTAETPGIRGQQFRALLEDGDGSLWIGTYGAGLIRIKNGQVRQFDESNGLFDNTVSCILPDDQGRLWLAGNQGLTIVRNRGTIDHDPAPLISLLNAGDGLSPSEFNGGYASSCYRDGSGRMWFSMIKGFAMVDPARFRKLAPQVPVAHIEQVKINGNDIGDSAMPMTLDAKASMLEIRYSGIALTHPELLRFRYRMNKRGQDWLDAGSNRTLLIPVLPWGKFAFEVQAGTLGGAWSPAAKVEFDRPAPWYHYQSIWLAVSALMIFGLLWIMRRRPRETDYTERLKKLQDKQVKRTPNFPAKSTTAATAPAAPAAGES